LDLWSFHVCIMTDLIYKEESYRIIGACFEVYKEKGNGFLETVYRNVYWLTLDITRNSNMSDSLIKNFRVFRAFRSEKK
jgi:hypothetical protein